METIGKNANINTKEKNGGYNEFEKDIKDSVLEEDAKHENAEQQMETHCSEICDNFSDPDAISQNSIANQELIIIKQETDDASPCNDSSTLITNAIESIQVTNINVNLTNLESIKSNMIEKDVVQQPQGILSDSSKSSPVKLSDTESESHSKKINTSLEKNSTNPDESLTKIDGTNFLEVTAIEDNKNLGASAKTSTYSPPKEVGETKKEIIETKSPVKDILLHVDCLAEKENLRKKFEQQIEQLKAALMQKDNMITLYQRENTILEKEKQAFRKEKEMATKEKESIVIKFAMKEKLLIDSKKEKEKVEKQLENAKTEIKNISLRFQAVNEEKSRVGYIIDEKCNEVRKYQRECEKLKTEISHLESKLKYHVNKLNMEVEAKNNLEKRLEEERKAPSKLEEQLYEKFKVEMEANTILLKHEIESNKAQLESLRKDLNKANDINKQLQEQLDNVILEHKQCYFELETLRNDHSSLENSYSEEMLNSAKLRTQLEGLHVLKTQNALNEEKISDLNATIKDLESLIADNKVDLDELHTRELELLSINKEMSESIVQLQNEIILLKAKAQGLEAENEILKEKNAANESKIACFETELKKEIAQKNEERHLLTKHLSEKTKLYEVTKVKLDNIVGDFEASQNKQNTIIKELQREIQKYKKSISQSKNMNDSNITKEGCSYCQNMSQNGYTSEHSDVQSSGSRAASDSSESGTVISNNAAVNGPSKKHLVERILRLQQASARQTEKIDFLENHTLALVSELQKKSKVVQYYMLRDQSGALTSTKSDQNKTELAKYGNGVMSAIYGGIKGDNHKGMTLELSLEINKKLQAVLEDTLLKNITLKENLDVLGLEVDNLTRKLRQLEAREQ